MGKKSAEAAAENVKVLVRCRPLNEKEKDSGCKSCVELDLTAHTVSVRSICGEPDRWTFDAVINNTFSQKDIFTQFIMPLVDFVLDGFNATVFAYGQSGSGKTHTMTGALDDDDLEGVTPRCVKHIFSSIKDIQAGSSSKSFSMYVSFVEIYNGKVRDLLSKQQQPLDVRESKDHCFFVQGVNIPQVKFPEDVNRLMEEGTERRRTGATELNADSSRSHSIFTLVLECFEALEGGTTTSVTSKLNLVDLAGSERQGKTGATGDALKEGCNINLSLSALGTVIDTIVKGGAHIPFRSSPLTMLLKDSLGGNSKTVMFANINPSERNLSETVTTLRFADRAKQIKNKPVVNMDTKDQKIAELSQLVNELREKLKKYETQSTLDMEKDIERLQERVGELNVELENVQRGRDADEMDFRSVQAKLLSERQEYVSKVIQMEEQLAQLHNDLLIAETNARSERSQREEVLQLCTKYLIRDHGVEERANGSLGALPSILNVKELTGILKKLSDSGSGGGAEVAKLNTKIQTLVTANSNLKKELEALQMELDARMKNAKGASGQNRQERERALAEPRDTITPEPTHDEVVTVGTTPICEDDKKALLAAVEEVRQQIDNFASLRNLDERLQDLTTQSRKLVDGTAKELSQASQLLAKFATETDLEMFRQLCSLLSDTNRRSDIKLKMISDFYQLLRVIRSGWRQAYTVPATILLNGDRDAARKAIAKMERIDAEQTGVHMKVVDKLTREVSKAYAQRNTVLERIADGYPDLSVDLKKEIRMVIAENQELHNECRSLKAEEAKPLASDSNKKQRSVDDKGAIEKMRATAPAAFQLARCGSQEKIPKELGNAQYNGSLISSSHTSKCSHGYALKSEDAAAMEVERLCGELEEQRAQCVSMEEARNKLYQDLVEKRREASAAEERAAKLQGQLKESECDYQRRLYEAQSSVSEVAQLQARVEERNAQIEQLRSVLDIQKSLILRSNNKVDVLTEELKNVQAAAARAEEEHRTLCETRDANVQQLINSRVAEYVEGRMQENKERNQSLRKVKRKMQKLQEWITKLECMYDEKVCECEELREVLSERKLEHLKLVRQLHDGKDAEIDGHREQIQTTLDRVKEERRRRVDLFDLGEFPNAKSTPNPVGFMSSSSDKN